MFNQPEKLKPLTASEIQECQTPEGIRRRLWTHGRYCNPIIYAVMEQARLIGLKGEDMYTLLAWHALLQLEDLQEAAVANAMQRKPSFDIPLL